MYAREDIHPGLLVISAEHSRARQQQLTRTVIAFIVGQAADAGEAPSDFRSTSSSRSATADCAASETCLRRRSPREWS